MVPSELAARLNCAEYKNWVKAGHCLLLLRGCLQGFVGREVLAFHRALLAAAPGLGPQAACRSGSRCSPRARQVSTWTGAPATALHPIPVPHPVRERSVPCPPWGAADCSARGSDTQTRPSLRGPSSPPPLVVSASVSGVRSVETGNFETSYQQKWRRLLGKLPAGPLARRRLGGSQGKHLRSRG